MLDALAKIVSPDGFMPHGHCYLWTPTLVWLQLLTNLFIAIAYFAISATLAHLVYRVRDIPFRWMYVAFGVFIITCGLTHLFHVWTIWTPVYWLDGVVRAVTAVASVGTAVMLPPLVPKAIAIARGAKAAHERGVELESAVDELATLYERTKQLEEAKSQFFANVSHELRTPLTLILGPVERLRESPNLDDEQRWQLDIVGRNARTLLRHVNDVLDASRLESGQLGARYERCDLAEVVRSVATGFEAVAHDRDVRFTLDVGGPVEAEVDVDKIERVVLNLLSNAFKFTPDHGVIRVALEPPAAGAERLVLLVEDSGPGIPPPERQVVFERFRQADGSVTRRYGGTGLGLSIVKDFVELHRGEVSIHDSALGGAAFRVELARRAPAGVEVPVPSPRTDDEVLRTAAIEELQPQPPPPRPERVPVEDELRVDGGAPLVLVVEDNVEMRLFLRSVLEERYRVETAGDGEEGLARALELRPDLIVSDVMMPRMSGDQLVARAREHEALASVPILLLTAKADEALRLELLETGAQDYMLKPFARGELLARVGNLVVTKRARDLLQTELEHQEQSLERLAAEVARRKRELSIAVDAMRSARDHAVQAAQARSTFLSLVSHELRTPLTSLRLQLQRLSSAGEPLSDKQRQMVTRMDSSSNRLLQLIDALLEHSRVQAGGFLARHEPLSPAAVVAEAVEDLRPQATEKGLALTLEKEHAPGEVVGDARALRLIVMNLIDNAVKYTDEGEVRVTLDGDDGAYRVRVEDTGPGIAPEAQVRVFEPFEQGEAIRHKHTPGVGLGLALVRDMAEAMGGEVSLQSSLGQGATFTVRLPTTPPPPAATDGEVRPSAS